MHKERGKELFKLNIIIKKQCKKYNNEVEKININIPNKDIELAKKYGFTFDIYHREDYGKQWLIVEQNIQSIEEAIDKAIKLPSNQVAIYTMEGSYYWDSMDPDCFNTTVIENGVYFTRDKEFFDVIEWRCYIKAKSKEKVMRVIQRMENLIGEIKVQNCKKYWKDESNFEVQFTSILNIKEKEHAVYNALQIVDNIAHSWEIAPPLEYENNRILFKGLSIHGKVPGLTWVEFIISNYEDGYSGNELDND